MGLQIFLDESGYKQSLIEVDEVRIKRDALAKIIESAPENKVVECQEQLYVYDDEIEKAEIAIARRMKVCLNSFLASRHEPTEITQTADDSDFGSEWNNDWGTLLFTFVALMYAAILTLIALFPVVLLYKSIFPDGFGENPFSSETVNYATNMFFSTLFFGFVSYVRDKKRTWRYNFGFGVSRGFVITAIPWFLDFLVDVNAPTSEITFGGVFLFLFSVFAFGKGYEAAQVLWKSEN